MLLIGLETIMRWDRTDYLTSGRNLDNLLGLKAKRNDYKYKKRRIKKTKVYDTYWQFACERQNIFMRKLMGKKIILRKILF